MSRKAAILSFLIASVVVAGAVSYWASESPDGLEKSMEDHGLLPPEEPADAAALAPGHPRTDQVTPRTESHTPAPALTAPMADYQVTAISNRFVSNAVAGVAGTLLVLAVLLLVGRLLRKRPAVPGNSVTPAGNDT